MTNKYIKYEIYIAKTYTKYAFFATAQLKLKPSENVKVDYNMCEFCHVTRP